MRTDEFPERANVESKLKKGVNKFRETFINLINFEKDF